ncbi:hypothetical protein pdam_00016665, partial [Pocillopora damicornis]
MVSGASKEYRTCDERAHLPGPLCAPLAYHPSFKVVVRLYEPLWKVRFSPDDVAIEVLTLCSQGRTLEQKEYAEGVLKRKTIGKIDAGHKVEYQNKFEPK